jgi:hypothetical protein
VVAAVAALLQRLQAEVAGGEPEVLLVAGGGGR